LAHRASPTPLGPIAAIWAPHWRYLLSAVQVHTTTQSGFLQRTALGNEIINKGNNKITELRAILQRECQNS